MPVTSPCFPTFAAIAPCPKSSDPPSPELPDGYSYSVLGEQLSLAELGEWMALERLCRPFLSFELVVSGTNTLWWLTLTGPAGTKPVLERAFPL